MTTMSMQLREAPAVARRTGRSWSIAVDLKSEWLTASRDSGRFAGAERARIAQEWRNSAYEAAWIAQLPTDLACIHVAAAARFRRNGTPPPAYKPDSLRPTLRAIISGLGPEERYLRQGKRFVAKGWGLISKIDDRHIAYPDITFGEWLLLDSTSPGQMLVTITELQPQGVTEDLPYRPRRGARGVCRECDLEDLKLTPNGLVWAHRVRRIGTDGIEYLTDEKCPGGGHLPVPEEQP